MASRYTRNPAGLNGALPVESEEDLAESILAQRDGSKIDPFCNKVVEYHLDPPRIGGWTPHKTVHCSPAERKPAD